MQYKFKDYVKEIHDKFMAVSLPEKEAESITKGETHLILSKTKTRYRGELIVCSEKYPYGTGEGETKCKVNLVGWKPIGDLNQEELSQINTIYENHRGCKYVLQVEYPRRMIEFPVKGKIGIWKLVYTKDVLIEYPTELGLDDYGERANAKKGLIIATISISAALATFIIWMIIQAIKLTIN